MLSLKTIVLLAACLSWTNCKVKNYCSLCTNHTMCTYTGLGKNCKKPGPGGVSNKEKNEILDLHNWARRTVASGKESRGGGQPPAANMRKMFWDKDLAQVAQRWADQCRFQHDSCRNDPRWNVGQNIYWKYQSPTHPVNWTEAILTWLDEVSTFNNQHVPSFKFQPETGHYTQMVWHDTYLIGCGRRDYGKEKIYVCNYGPSGNWMNEPVYDIGQPCSKCPRGTVCEEFLCVAPSYKIQNQVSQGVGESHSQSDVPPSDLNYTSLTNPTELEQNTFRGVVPLQKSVDQKCISGNCENEEESLSEGEMDGEDLDMVDNDIVLDEKMRKEIDRVHSQMEKVLKTFIKNIRNIRKERRS